MAPPAEKFPPLPVPPVTPSMEAWRAMSPEARARFINEVNTVLSDPLRFMGEGLPHSKAKRRAVDRLRMHFDAIGRVIFLVDELSVLYPGEPGARGARCRRATRMRSVTGYPGGRTKR